MVAGRSHVPAEIKGQGATTNVSMCRSLRLIMLVLVASQSATIPRLTASGRHRRDEQLIRRFEDILSAVTIAQGTVVRENSLGSLGHNFALQGF